MLPQFPPISAFFALHPSASVLFCTFNLLLSIAFTHLTWICSSTTSLRTSWDSQASLGGGCCDQFHDHGIIHQRLAAPVLTDPGKEAMLNFIPFAGSWRQMTDSDCQTDFIGEVLKFPFP